MSAYKTASIVFLLLTLIIALVLSGLSQKRASSCGAKAPVAAAKTPVAVAKAPVAVAKVQQKEPPVQSTVSPYSGVPQSVAYHTAYVTGSVVPAASSDRAFEYLITPMPMYFPCTGYPSTVVMITPTKFRPRPLPIRWYNWMNHY